MYGFFVKGEAIAGTIDDISATDTSLPASGASTPPTSASDTEALAAKMSEKKSKRKRGDTDAASEGKKTNKDRKVKKEEKVDGKDQAVVAAKIAKLKPSEKAEYETRAAAKGQTLEQYVSRRIQKKEEKRAAKYIDPLPNLFFFTDVEGDSTLLNSRPTTPPIAYTPVLDSGCPIGSEIWEKHGGDTAFKHEESGQHDSQPAQDFRNSGVSHDETLTEEVQGKLIQEEVCSESSQKLGRQLEKCQNAMQPLEDLPHPTEVENSQEKQFTYTPLADGSCPLDPAIWQGLPVKKLPAPVKEARRRFKMEQSLAKKVRAAKAGNMLITGLGKPERKLLRRKVLQDRGIDPTKATPEQILSVHKLLANVTDCAWGRPSKEE